MSASGLYLLLAALHFVSPLVFFTDLTRNPYVTQIVFLNIGLLSALAWAILSRWPGPWQLRRTPLDLPLAGWVAVCAFSWILSYFGHLPFYREAMRAEGSRVMLFVLINACLPFYLAALCSDSCPEEPAVPIGRWAAFAVVWGVLWTFYPQIHDPAGMATSIWGHVWDPYGGLLWAGGLGVVLWLSRRGGMHELWHVALTAGFLGAAYGVCQYFNWEFVWSKTLNPYGGRSVSTFGNPNFMSSYMVVLMPLAVTYYLKSRTRLSRGVYAVVALTLEASLLSSLTRSSWVGALAAVAVLALSPELRSLAKRDIRFSGLVVVAGLALLVLWPQSAVGHTPTVFTRLTEISEIIRPKDLPYSPFYQRVLIWACAWRMGAENPLLGNGWGLFELFYPFYQGHLLDVFDFFSNMRTHANNAHNEILEFWAQTGIAGVGVLFWIWSAFFRSAFGDLKRGSVWTLACAAGVLGMLVDNLLNVSLHFAVPAFLFWWQAGAAMGRKSVEQRWGKEFNLGKSAASVACSLAVGLCLWGMWHWVCVWNREAHYFMGFKLVRHDRLPQAIEELETAHRWSPREVNNDYELGNAYARAQEYSKSVWAYQEALRSNAGYDEIYFNLALVLAQRIGDKEGALKNYRMSWGINPLSYPLYVSLSAFYLADPAKYHEACVELLERAVHFFPQELNFLSNLGYLYSLGREPAKAEGIYAQVLRLNPDLAVAEKNLRASLAQSGDRPPEILGQLEKLRRLEARLHAKDYGAQSLELARQTAQFFPEYPKIKLYLARLDLQHGNAQEAEELLRFVLAKNPREPMVLLGWAQALQMLGRREEAVEALRRVLEVDPNNPYALGALRGR